MYSQKVLSVRSAGQGSTDITASIESLMNNEISQCKIGLCHVFIKHTSASVCIASPQNNNQQNQNNNTNVKNNGKKRSRSRSSNSSRGRGKNDELFVNDLVPERSDYIHNYEGDDDMPAHGKCVLIGSEFYVPITNGTLNILKDEQRIYLMEHRYHAYSRNIVITVQGCK